MASGQFGLGVGVADSAPLQAPPAAAASAADWQETLVARGFLTAQARTRGDVNKSSIRRVERR